MSCSIGGLSDLLVPPCRAAAGTALRTAIEVTAFDGTGCNNGCAMNGGSSRTMYGRNVCDHFADFQIRTCVGIKANCLCVQQNSAGVANVSVV